jgi:hypothetical protein
MCRCFQQETSEHMIISCPYKQDIWVEVLKTFIAIPNNIDHHLLHQDILKLDFSCYTLLELDLHCSVVSSFPCCNTWKGLGVTIVEAAVLCCVQLMMQDLQLV